MGGEYTLDLMVKIIAYGVPALLIVFGFFAYTVGYSVRFLTQDTGMTNLGLLLMTLGIIFYIAEFAVKVYDYFQD